MELDPHDVEGWLAKHRTIEEIQFAIRIAQVVIKELSSQDPCRDPYELAVWRARLPHLKATALLLGLQLEE